MGFGFGFWEYIIVGAVIFSVFAGGKMFKGGWSPGPALVLKIFSINKTATGQEALINIVGRHGGLISWFLTMVGIDTTSSMTVTSSDVSIKDTSLFGQQHSVIAISSISSVHCGYRIPFAYIFVGVAGLLACIVQAISQDSFKIFLIGCIFAAICFVLFFLRKTIVIYLWPRAGVPAMGMAFKRSVIENVSFGLQEAELAAGIISSLVIRAQDITKVTSEMVMKDAAQKVNESNFSGPSVCARCGNPLEEGALFCTSCGQSIK